MSNGIVIFAHGSSVHSANEAVFQVARTAAAAGNFDQMEVAFLEAEPTLAEAISRLSARGVKRILIVPYFLTLGIHLQRDLPAMVTDLAGEHGSLEIRVAPPLDGHPALVQILLDRSREAMFGWT